MHWTSKAIVAMFGVAAALFVGGIVCRHYNVSLAYETATKAAELIILSGGFISILLVRNQLSAQERQLRENRAQMISDHRWKTFISYHQLFPDSFPPAPLRASMYTFAKDHGFRDHFDAYGKAMPEDALKKCINDSEMWEIFRPYLDCFERFCGAVNAGMIDEAYAMTLERTRVIRNFTVFEELIKHLQKDHPNAYVELTKLASKWAMQLRLEIFEAQSQLGAGAGTKTRIDSPI